MVKGIGDYIKAEEEEVNADMEPETLAGWPSKWEEPPEDCAVEEYGAANGTGNGGGGTESGAGAGRKWKKKAAQQGKGGAKDGTTNPGPREGKAGVHKGKGGGTSKSSTW